LRQGSALLPQPFGLRNDKGCVCGGKEKQTIKIVYFSEKTTIKRALL
jgi:hypothetical protein